MMRGLRDGAWAKSGASLPYGGLCFTANVADSSVTLSKVGSPPAVTLVKSFDGKNWSEYPVGETIVLQNPGDRVFLAAGGSGNYAFASATSDYHKFVMTGSVSASGDISSLRSFGLSHDALANYCYTSIFNSCTGLTSAPELPVTMLAKNCYSSMFRGCTGLTSAPELPATMLVTACYSFMFYGCVSLTSLKVHFTEWGTHTLSWLVAASTTGTFYKPSTLPDIRNTSHIPNAWEVVNID